MFFMFDAVNNRQITTHGEYTLQAIGRLCSLTTDESLARMAPARTPPRLWTSYSCYGVIRAFALCVQQWVAAMQSKAVDESIGEAVVRCIKSDPQGFAALHMVYALPTSDPRWARKELWVRQSRLMRADKLVGEGVRSASKMPLVADSFGIRHNPERDKRERVDRLTREGEMGQEGMDSDEDEQQRPQQRRRVARDAALCRWFRQVQTHINHHADDLDIAYSTAQSYLSRLQRAITSDWIPSADVLRLFANGPDASTHIAQHVEATRTLGVRLPADIANIVNDLKSAIDKAVDWVALPILPRCLIPSAGVGN